MSNRYQIDQRAALFGARGPRPRPAPDADRSSTSCALEQQNDEQLDDLESRIHTLRQISEDINSEVSDSNKLLGGMDSQFDKARGMLKGTMGRLNVMVQQGGAKAALPFGRSGCCRFSVDVVVVKATPPSGHDIVRRNHRAVK
eukprot:CAMPEP_0204313516 /NCGR_PEP_ID=MMETSP0469-20131031/3644_1 /ASSEMBLY_ACC=CAM_ASM_000384 /TAXON_ID=2969 /ORGANISM="Oxyrrhis marina" /LENGTH=142 /DNA_ID=CAMNT_0051293825 /DNA_START=40 /DNA_END=467 /DNA_ORIENTATION=+